jgi:hypothetical protein
MGGSFQEGNWGNGEVPGKNFLKEVFHRTPFQELLKSMIKQPL